MRSVAPRGLKIRGVVFFIDEEIKNTKTKSQYKETYPMKIYENINYRRQGDAGAGAGFGFYKRQAVFVGQR